MQGFVPLRLPEPGSRSRQWPRCTSSVQYPARRPLSQPANRWRSVGFEPDSMMRAPVQGLA